MCNIFINMLSLKTIICISLISMVFSIPLTNGDFVEKSKIHQFVITEVSPSEFYPSEVKTINITLQNIQEYPVYNLTFKIDPKEAEPIKFIDELMKHYKGGLYPDEKYTLQYKIYIKDTLEKGVYYVPLVVMWSTLQYGVVTLVQEDLYVGIEVVENPKDFKIDITDIIAPTNIKAGDTFIVKINIKNVGKKKVGSIIAKLELPPRFASIGSDTEEYVESLEPNSSAETVFNLQVDKQAISQLYNLDFTLEYKDENNRVQEKNSSFGIMVDENPPVDIQDIILEPTKLTPGTDGLLMIQVINAGTNKIKNVKISIYGGENLLLQSHNFIGEISPGNSETTSFGVYVNPDKIKIPEKIKIKRYGLNIQISYEDIIGNSYTKSKIYTLSVIKESSLIPISGTGIRILVGAFIFIIISYVIFWITGSRIRN